MEQKLNNSQTKKHFIKINDEFICMKCGEHNPPLDKTCRNHCRKCLFSQHVDDAIPGDRKSSCKAPMEPYAIDQSQKKGYIIKHKCISCGKIIPNKAAPDDNFEKIIQISQIQNEQTGNPKTGR